MGSLEESDQGDKMMAAKWTQRKKIGDCPIRNEVDNLKSQGLPDEGKNLLK